MVAYTSPKVSGAVDLSECPYKHACACRPRCRKCGYGKHAAVHGPVFGQPPGSKPYDHEYEAINEK